MQMKPRSAQDSPARAAINRSLRRSAPPLSRGRLQVDARRIIKKANEAAEAAARALAYLDAADLDSGGELNRRALECIDAAVECCADVSGGR